MRILALLVCLVGNVMLMAQTHYNTSSNPWWPMTVGNRWIFMNPNSVPMGSTNWKGSPTVITVQPSPADYGCGLSGGNAVPWLVTISKVHPTNYWAIGATWNIQWELGVLGTNQAPLPWDGAVFGLGWSQYDYWNQQPNSATGFDFVSQVSQVPPYLLLSPSGYTCNLGELQVGRCTVPQSGEYQVIGNSDYPQFSSFPDFAPASPPAEPNISSSCLSDNPRAPLNCSWTVTWDNYTNNLVVPGYGETGGAFAAHAKYNEQCNNGGQAIEDWYFAQNVGPVQIQTEIPPTHYSNGTLQLVSFIPGNGTATPPYVTLRDALLTTMVANNPANYNGNAQYSQWSSAFTQITDVKAPTAAQSCWAYGTSSESVDTYLSALEQVGSPTCTALQYPNTPNGQSANSMLQWVESPSYANTTVNLNSYEWNYYYLQYEGQSAVGTTKCSLTATDYLTNTGITMYPSTTILLDGRQWLLLYESPLLGCAH